jgi:NAD(P)-dependent dehydrogenase (short-subunit alcohol dehydrogenase family)
MELLTGKTAVVTGASSGMGRSFALRFAKAGMNVVVADIDEVGLGSVAGEVRALGGNCVTHIADVSQEQNVQALAEAAISEFGRVNVLCNNAGVAGRFLGSGQIDLADWRWVMDINFWGVVYGHKVFLPHLLEHGDGHIINTASMAGHFPAHSAYGASKWAVVGISEGLFHQLHEMRSTVGVSCLCPGWIATNIASTALHRPEAISPGVQQEMSSEDQARYEFVSELVRTGLSPDHVADLVHDAILSKQFWIFTHPDMVAGLQTRYDAILQGTNPVRMSL